MSYCDIPVLPSSNSQQDINEVERKKLLFNDNIFSSESILELVNLAIGSSYIALPLRMTPDNLRPKEWTHIRERQ